MNALIDLPKAQIEILEGDILCIRYKDGFEVGIEDAREIDQIQFDLCAGKKVAILVDINQVSNTVTKEAKNYFNNKGKMLRQTKGVAIFQKDKQKNLRTNLWAELLRPLYLTKSFENREAALKWLRTL